MFLKNIFIWYSAMQVPTYLWYRLNYQPIYTAWTRVCFLASIFWLSVQHSFCNIWWRAMRPDGSWPWGQDSRILPFLWVFLCHVKAKADKHTKSLSTSSLYDLKLQQLLNGNWGQEHFSGQFLLVCKMSELFDWLNMNNKSIMILQRLQR